MSSRVEDVGVAVRVARLPYSGIALVLTGSAGIVLVCHKW